MSADELAKDSQI